MNEYTNTIFYIFFLKVGGCAVQWSKERRGSVRRENKKKTVYGKER